MSNQIVVDKNYAYWFGDNIYVFRTGELFKIRQFNDGTMEIIRAQPESGVDKFRRMLKRIEDEKQSL